MPRADAIFAIKTEISNLIAKDWRGQIGKRWTPPFGMLRHAEHMEDHFTPGSQAQRPILKYVGTVIHEKFLRRAGQEPGSRTMQAIPATEELASDRALDRQIYALLGCEGQGEGFRVGDGKGWKHLLWNAHPDGVKSEACNYASRQRSPVTIKMNAHEYQAITILENDWIEEPGDDASKIFVRNTFGLDEVALRRTIVSWFNSPTQHFKPAIYQGVAASILSAALNLRILVSDPMLSINQSQASSEQYNRIGHPRRSEPMKCIARSRNLRPGTTSCGNNI